MDPDVTIKSREHNAKFDRLQYLETSHPVKPTNLKHSVHFCFYKVDRVQQLYRVCRTFWDILRITTKSGEYR